MLLQASTNRAPPNNYQLLDVLFCDGLNISLGPIDTESILKTKAHLINEIHASLPDI